MGFPVQIFCPMAFYERYAFNIKYEAFILSTMASKILQMHRKFRNNVEYFDNILYKFYSYIFTQ